MQTEPVFAKITVVIDGETISKQYLKFEANSFEDQRPTEEEIIEVCANLALIDESDIDFATARHVTEEAYLQHCEEQYE
jgi:hypothetical protein